MELMELYVTQRRDVVRCKWGSDALYDGQNPCDRERGCMCWTVDLVWFEQ